MTILIIEDDERTARTLESLIKAVYPPARVIGICRSVKETVQVLATHKPDLLFMDVELPDGTCFDVFDQVDVASPVVFCTAHDDYMLHAFQTNGIAYLLKPVDEQAVEAVFAKVETLRKAFLPDLTTLGRLVLEDARLAPLYTRSFLVRLHGRVLPVAVDNVAAVSLENEVSQLYTYRNERYPLFKTMDEIEELLDPARFFRISRQMIVSRSAVVEIKSCFNRTAALTLTTDLPATPVVSRLKVTPFMKWMA